MEITAIPLALVAGAVSILSPCVWPLVPVVMGSAATGGRFGPPALALGLSLSFALAGTVLSFILVNAGLNPELFRYVAAALLIAVAGILLIEPLGDWVTLHLSNLTARFNPNPEAGGTALGQFGVGLLLGIVWLPCVGPTLGAAIALASMGQAMLTAFAVMFAFGIGTAVVLLIAGMLSNRVLARMRPQLFSGAGRGKQFLGWMLLLLGVMVLTGLDKTLEAWAIQWLPEWVFNL